ncbi:CAP domain [Plasmopara halstedii]|uniref:CAP domain n=1 Tax=Plasmopara halstedii TaxID=4781 RepID=A0A0P1B6R1_PLAHL|nr:CAP domain [Plasmopara halstedii]CEG49473.1 CAP domain [Plasmopara halstedii]|eukprot:XP_024585842.1 CAP domain [Plasmopara halstedii]
MKSVFVLALAALFSSSDADTTSDLQTNVLKAINDKRSEKGLANLCVNTKLVASAQAHADDMAAHNLVSARGSDGLDQVDRLKAQHFNYTAAATLVGAGYNTWDGMVEVWIANPGQYIFGSYSYMGVGHTENDAQQYKNYWTLDLAAGVGESCTQNPPH